ncbi:MAG: class IV adenylate cyclase [Chloroflexota bacterium]|nr:class IV adenylate cyclase [Chloroflexota bacterium]
MIERERKYKLPDMAVPDLRKRLENEGRWVRAGAEGDVFFDHPALHLQNEDRRLRLRFRDEGGVQELTYKSPREMHGVDKVRKEITAVLVSGPVEELIAELGFRRIRKFVKLREVYVLGEFEVSLDHLEGAGWFCEIEALTPSADIDIMAYDLGLRPRQLESRTYSEIVDEMSSAGEPSRV